MTEAILLAKNGTRIVTRDELDHVDPPEGTATWYPLKHSHVLATVEDTLNNGGFNVQSSQLALSNDGHRFFGTLTLGTSLQEGVALAVGVRSSTDKTFPIGLIAGSRVFVCSNLAFNSEIYVSKKHTRFGKERFDEGVSHALTALGQFQKVEAARIQHYRDLVLDESDAAACLLHAFEQGVLSTRTLPEAIKEWRQPALEDFAPRTAWSLFNAMTSALKQRQGNPAEFASLTMKLYGLLDRQANYTISA
jgi:hypothetical protein